MEQREKYHLDQLVEGKKESFAVLYTLYYSKVYHYCFRFIRSKEICQEITSDVFIRIWEKRALIDPNRPLGGLLMKISRDYCLDYLRKMARDESLRKSFIDQYIVGVQCVPYESLFMKEGMQMANQAISTLPPRCREVFHLRYFSGLSLIQIAEELKISPNTVQNHLQKGTRLVRTYLRSHTDVIAVLMLLIGT